MLRQSNSPHKFPGAIVNCLAPEKPSYNEGKFVVDGRWIRLIAVVLLMPFLVLSKGAGQSSADSRLRKAEVATSQQPIKAEIATEQFAFDVRRSTFDVEHHKLNVERRTSNIERRTLIRNLPAGEMPNLTPYKPSGWSDKIVVSTATGTNSDSSSLTTSDTIYVDWAAINNGTAATSARFFAKLYLDGVEKGSWFADPPLNINSYAYVQDFSLGSLSSGQHQIKIVVDTSGAIAESDETDNEYTKTITITGQSLPNLTPYKPSTWSDKIVVSTTTGTNSDSSTLATTDTLYVDWAVINNGTAATSATFFAKLFVDGVEKGSWSADPPLNVNFYGYVEDFPIGSLSAGQHQIKIVVDTSGAITESNETDNEYLKTITVVELPLTLRWVDANGSEVSSALDGTTVYMKVTAPGSPAGAQFTAQIFEVDTLSNDLKGTAVITIGSNGSGQTAWVARWEDDGPLNDPEFIFRVNNQDSPQLTVTRGPDIDVSPTSLTITQQPGQTSQPAGDFTPPDADDARFTIKLKSRRFIPAASDFLALQEEEPSARQHVILQFNELPGADELKTLAENGVQILNYVPNNAVAAVAPAGFDWRAFPSIRWRGRLLASDKISPQAMNILSQGGPADILNFVVEAFRDVPAAELESLIRDAGGAVIENSYLPHYIRLASGPAEVFNRLARQDAIAWIRVAPNELIENRPVYFCPGPFTLYGPIANFVIHDDGWDGPGRGPASLLYHFRNGTPDIASEESEVERAFAEWAKYARLTFTRTGSPGANRSIDILWASGDHGDGYPFDGPGNALRNTLAHAFFPSPPNSETIAGDIHFDEDETWSVTGNIHQFTIALHEAGHSLGLAHSDVSGAVMQAFYSGPVSGLHPDDIAAIQSIYAPVASNTFVIQNAGGGTLTINSITSNRNWLTTSDHSTLPFNLSGGSGQSITVNINWPLLGGVSQSGQLTIASNDPDEPSIIVTVTANPIANQAPTITTNPPTSATVGTQYQYDVNATDPDGDTLTYSLVTAPTGMTINSSTGLITWTPTSSQTGNNTVKVSVSDGKSNGTVFQEWIINVTQPTITVTAPAAGATWIVGAAQTVSWSSSGVAGNVNIKLSTDGGTSFPITLVPNTANDGTETVTAPNNPSTTCRIRVESISNTSAFGDNPGNFTIQDQHIIVIAPAAGATWACGVAQVVSWTSTGVTGNVNIKLSTDGGASFPIILASNTANDGTETVTAPNNPSTTCRIKVESLSNPNVFGISGTFTISCCIAVSIPTNLTGAAGSAITVPITVGDLTGKGVVSYDLSLSFDTNILTLQSVDATGTLSSSFNITTNTGTPGRVAVAAFGTNALSGAGTLLNLRFLLSGVPGRCSDLVWSSFKFNEGTPCSTTANGRVCIIDTLVISGTVIYGVAVRSVPDVTITASGTSSKTTTTTSSGAYQLTGLNHGGNYTVTPSKAGSTTAISALDASMVAQHVAGITTLSSNQQIAGDASGNGSLSSFDASLIAQTSAGIPNSGIAGTWKYLPANRSYNSLTSNQANQDFQAILVGDVTGNWTPPSTISASLTASQEALPPRDAAQASVSLPTTSAAQGASVTIPITVGNLTGLGVVAYDFEIAFNQNVLSPQNPATDKAGTLSSSMTIVENAATPGRLRVSAFGTSALSGSGTLLNLKFTVVGAPGSSTALTWQSFQFNEGEPQAITSNGQFSVPTPPTCPTVSGINPTSGPLGSTVTITGTNFTGVTAVRFFNNVLATFTVNSDSQITAIVPNAAVTGPITISKAGCNDALTSTFTVQTARVIRVVNSSGSPGSTVSVPIELVAQGNENALGLSLSYDPSILSNPQTAAGRDASSATLNINSNQSAQGRLGIALALPAGQTFIAGTRQIVVITFVVAPATTAQSTTISFIDQPISREVVDVAANPLAADYFGATIRLISDDKTAPTVTISAPTNGSFLASRTISVSGTAIDNSGGSGVASVSVNGAAASFNSVTGVFTATLTAASDGPFTISVTATDQAGNTSQAVTTVVTVDTRAPTVSITSPAALAFVPGRLIVTGTVSDENLRSVDVNGFPATISNNTFTVTLGGLTDGALTINVTATDRAGNSTFITRNVTVDATGPVITFIAPTANSDISLPVVVTIRVTDSSSGVDATSVAINGFAATGKSDGSFSATLTNLSQGSASITATARDRVGNNANSTINVTVRGTGIIGDVNGDGRVDTNDLLTLIQFLLGTTSQAPGADVNRDGVVDVADLIRLIIIIRGSLINTMTHGKISRKGGLDMVRREELTDEQWAIIEPLIPPSPRRRGRQGEAMERQSSGLKRDCLDTAQWG